MSSILIEKCDNGYIMQWSTHKIDAKQIVLDKEMVIETVKNILDEIEEVQ